MPMFGALGETDHYKLATIRGLLPPAHTLQRILHHVMSSRGVKGHMKDDGCACAYGSCIKRTHSAEPEDTQSKMRCLVISPEVFFILFLLWNSAQCLCSRSAPPGTDCSTANGECSLLYDKDDPNAYPTQIPYPPAK